MTIDALPTLSAEAVRAFLSENPGIDLSTYDFLDRSSADRLHWGVLDREDALRTVRAYQRMARLGLQPASAETLIGAGLHSANHIATIPPRRFIEQTAPSLGLSGDEATALHRRATTVRNKTFQLWAVAASAVRSRAFRESRFSTLGAGIPAVFEELPSYQELFGTLDYCVCNECRSIFGPAAYLVDLQRIIAEYVTTPNAATIPSGLSFPARRPDIGNLSLTCALTDTLVPYIQIVNERLLDFMQSSLNLGSADAVLEAAATTIVYPTVFPFNRPLSRLSALLQQAGAPLPALLAAWGSAPASVAAASAGFSPDQLAILTAPPNSAETVAPFFNQTASTLGQLADPDLFQAVTNLDFSGLLELIQEDLSPAEIAAGLRVNFFINAGLDGKVVSLAPTGAPPVFQLQNLVPAALDAINRQLRIGARLGWTQAQVDWALRASANGATPQLAGNDAAIIALAAMANASSTLGLTFLQAAALFGPIKTYGQSAGPTQFDALFNPPALSAAAGAYHPSGNPLNPAYKDTPLTWTPGSTATADVAAITRVLPGLGLNARDANILGLALFGGNAAQPLTVEILSALYRHAVVSGVLTMPMNRYVLLLSLLGQTPSDPFTAASWSALTNLASWMTKTSITVFQLDYIVNGKPSLYVKLPYRPAAVPAWQAALIKRAGQGGNDPGSLIVEQLASLVGVQGSQLEPFLRMAVTAVPAPASGVTWPEAFLAVDSSGAPLYPAYVAEVLAWCSRWLVLKSALSSSDAVMDSVALVPEAYGLPASFASLPLSSVQLIWNVQSIITTHGDTQNELLVYLDPPAGTQLPETLFNATGWPPAQTTLLLNGPLKTVTPVAAQLAAMNAIFNLLAAIGADVTLLSTLASVTTAPAAGNWAAYGAAAAAVFASVQSRYGAAWPTVAGSLTGTMLVAERDAWLSWVFETLHGMFTGITTFRNVFEYMLIDVQMGPETQISYIKEALNACQLYLQRCNLGLEMGVVELDIAPSWWEWLVNYRVWQANREVFVYPESYLLPTLLTNSTPQYASLQDALQQSAVTDAYADEVFSTYVQDFLTATQLQPVETYRATITDPVQGSVGCTFVFGKSNTDPVTYYWAQQIDNMPWTAWNKIDVSINAAAISPVYAFGRLFVFWLETTTVAGSAIEVVGGSGSASTSNTTVKAAISYSFLNTQNKWVQPQTLLSEEVVFYTSSGSGNVALLGNPIFAGLFDFASQSWQRPAVLHVTAANFSAPTATSEKICVFYGPILPDTVSPIDPGPPPPSGNAPAMAFYESLRASVLDHNALVTGQVPGYQPLQPAIVIDALLNDSFVFHDAEVFALDAYAGPVPLNQVSAQFSITSGSLLLSSSPTPVTDNLIADPNVAVVTQATAPTVNAATFITPSIPAAVATKIFSALQTAGVLTSGSSPTVNAATLATTDLRTALAGLVAVGTFGFSQLMDVQQALYSSLPGTPLFSGVGPTGIAIATVKNQPGWFVLFAGGEAFLLAPKQSASAAAQPVFTPIDQSASIGPPLITAATFVSSVVSNGTTYTITEAQAANIMLTFQSQQLQIVSPAGVYNENANFTLVSLSLANMKLPAQQIQMIFNLLNGAPVVGPDVFTSIPGISAATSASIYQALSSPQLSIIDISGRVSPNNLIPGVIALAVAPLITAGKMTMFQVPAVYATLLTAVMPVAVNYQNRGNTSSFSGPSSFLYTVTRLTTAAVEKLERALFAGSVPALLSTSMQWYPVIPILPFSRFGPKAANVVMPAALDGTQVDFDGLYGEYFWEIFFHVPRLVADMLQNNQQFSDAITWLQYIFNPTTQPQPVTPAVIVNLTAAAGGNAINAATAAAVITQLEGQNIGTPPSPILSNGVVNPQFSATTALSFLTSAPAGLTTLQISFVQAILLNYQLSAPSARYWQFFPFRNYTQETLTAMLSDAGAISVYNNDPFDPYAIARLRIGAFEKTTVMQYIDTLIAWGDMLFTADTWETITAASLLYTYASDLLGPRPVAVGECPGAGLAVTFNQIAAANPKGIPQFLIDLEGLVPDNGSPTPPILAHAFNDLDVYFCVPENAQLMSYWDTVDDRLFKIEHSENIAGQFRALALFQPPLDPLDLVKAAAAGVNVLSVATSGAPLLPAYRFTSALAFASQMVDAVIGFGAELLAALEKNDAEALSTLQTGQATRVLQMTVTMKQQRITELTDTLASLQATLDSAQYRQTYYSGLIAENINPQEQTSLDAMATALAANIAAGVMTTAASIGYAVPQVGSPFAMTYGGQQIGNAINAAAGVFEIGAEVASYISSRSLTMAGYTRRMQDWQLQLQLATYDVQQIQAAIDACQQQIRQATQDLAITNVQLAQNQAIAAFLTSKFTNQQLYGWMIGQLSTTYFQAFQVAVGAANAAQGAYQFETDTDATFVSFNYWNTLYKGLLAGEGLKASLDSMAASYRQLNTRRLEITKYISLGMLDPEQLLLLKATGQCTFSFPEELFDYDYPGHYARKITSISVSIPAVLGPYQTVKATLTQTKNQVVMEPDISVVNFLLGISSTPPASGLRTNWAGNQSVALSQALNESGLFVLDFGDERYLPFENTGAVSTWQLDMPLDTNRFDFAQLSDVIFTLRYTALADATLATSVRSSLASAPFLGGVYIDALRSQPAAWFSFTTSQPSSHSQTLSLTVPFAQSGYFKTFSVTTVWIRLDLAEGLTLPTGANFLTLTAGSQAPSTPTFGPNDIAELDGLSWPGTDLTAPWTLAFNLASTAIAPLLTNGRIDPAKLLDVEMVVVYEATIF